MAEHLLYRRVGYQQSTAGAEQLDDGPAQPIRSGCCSGATWLLFSGCLSMHQEYINSYIAPCACTTVDAGFRPGKPGGRSRSAPGPCPSAAGRRREAGARPAHFTHQGTQLVQTVQNMLSLTLCNNGLKTMHIYSKSASRKGRCWVSAGAAGGSLAVNATHPARRRRQHRLQLAGGDQQPERGSDGEPDIETWNALPAKAALHVGLSRLLRHSEPVSRNRTGPAAR